VLVVNPASRRNSAASSESICSILMIKCWTCHLEFCPVWDVGQRGRRDHSGASPSDFRGDVTLTRRTAVFLEGLGPEGLTQSVSCRSHYCPPRPGKGIGKSFSLQSTGLTSDQISVDGSPSQ
jgi:hypothetical protein